ncbi:MAG TPA: ferredoxin [Bacillota bacterium]|jgi:ferredoxin|nr:ferredoxin [Bacillota bacterium]HOB86817.1 ferredoxin [Bacillota bacterium]HOP69914.1 ferredoxin [Bacillota bacterium]HPT33589.1 ferredoxin [Bacillota bacterium]HPZ65207.1 ferredoxin [Bacillota bacterium]
MEVRVSDECSACGVCEDICPEVFELGDEKAEVKVNPVPAEYEDKCREAAEECPTEAIEISE